MDTINLQPSMEDVVPILWQERATILATTCQWMVD